MATAATTMRASPLPPRLPPGSTVRSLSWLRRRNSSRSGGVGPDGCCPEPQGPLPPPPDPHIMPPWLLLAIPRHPAASASGTTPPYQFVADILNEALRYRTY